jgi:hypothetical protein
MDSCYVYSGLGAVRSSGLSISAPSLSIAPAPAPSPTISSPTPTATKLAVKSPTTTLTSKVSTTQATTALTVARTRAKEKARRKGLAVAAAKKAAALMKKGESLDSAWAKAGGESDVLKQLKALVVTQGNVSGFYAGFGATATSTTTATPLTVAEISEIANAAFSTLKSNGAFTVTTTKTTSVPAPSLTTQSSATTSQVPIRRSPSVFSKPTATVSKSGTVTPTAAPAAAEGMSTQTKLLVGGGVAGLIGLWLMKRKKK